MSSENNKYKKIENLGWEAFAKTGDINCYGMVVSARELAKTKEKENEENQMGM